MSEVNAKRHIMKTKNIAPGFAFSNVIKSEPYIDEALLLLEKRLDSLSEANSPVNFDEWFNFLAFDILGEVTFSQQFGFLDRGCDVGNAIANTHAIGVYVSDGGGPLKFKTPTKFSSVNCILSAPKNSEERVNRSSNPCVLKPHLRILC